ncbi:uncharacterized protein LOC134765306 [Penaeus indicus]|uniref:uncharacterized protein LOC134765306 n=1 Tax=Penaeus indicus TaxID=29960 RepID=UPI00300C9116
MSSLGKPWARLPLNHDSEHCPWNTIPPLIPVVTSSTQVTPKPPGDIPPFPTSSSSTPLPQLSTSTTPSYPINCPPLHISVQCYTISPRDRRKSPTNTAKITFHTSVTTSPVPKPLPPHPIHRTRQA